MELNGKNVRLVYADNIVIFWNRYNKLYAIKATEKLIKSIGTHRMNLDINDNKIETSVV